MSLAELFYAKHPRRVAQLFRRRPRRAPSLTSGVRLETLEPRVLLSVTVPGLATADDILPQVAPEIHDNLQPVADAVQGAVGSADFQSALDLRIPALLDTTSPSDPHAPRLGDLLDVSAFVSDYNADGVSDFSDVFQHYFMDDVLGLVSGASSLSGLVNDIDAIGGTFGTDDMFSYDVSGVTGVLNDLNSAEDSNGPHELRFTATFTLSRTATFDFEMGRNADLFSIGVDLSNPAVLSFILPDVDVAASIDFGFTFGATANLTVDPDADNDGTADDPQTTIDPGDFFVDASGPGQGLSARAHIDDSVGSFALTVGFLDAHVTGGSLDLDAIATIPFDGSSGALVAQPIDTSAGSIDADLSVSVDPGLTIVGSLGSPQIHLSGNPYAPGMAPDGTDDPRTAPIVSVSDFDDLRNFRRVAPDGIVGVVEQIGDAFDGIRKSSFFDTPVPFTSDKTLKDLLPLGDIVDDGLAGLHTDSGPTFGSAQELATKIQAALASGATVDAQYDVASDELTYHIKLEKTFDDLHVPIDLSLDLGALAGIDTDVTLTIGAHGTVEFIFGVDLSGPTGDSTLVGIRDAHVTATGSPPSSGILTSDAVLTITLDPGEPGESVHVITVRADATDGDDPGTDPNTGIDDLIQDLRAALAAETVSPGVTLGQILQVQKVEDGGTHLRLSQSGSALLVSFRVEASGASLGFGALQNAEVSGPRPDGVLSGDATFEVTVNGGDPVEVFVAADSGNTSLQDLADDINDALTLVGLDSIAVAQVLGNRLSLVASGGDSLRVDFEPGNAAQELGFQDGVATASHDEPEAFFVRDVSVDAGLSLDANPGAGPDATARFGFVGLQVTDIDGTLDADVSLSLRNPLTHSSTDRIDLDDLYDALTSSSSAGTTPADLITGFDVAGSGGTLTLDGISLYPSALSGLTLGADPHIDITLDDLDDLSTLSVTPHDLGEVVDFANVDFTDIGGALGLLSDLVGEFSNIPSFGTPLPIINRSLNDLLGYANVFGDMLADFNANPALVVQSLEQRLEQALGLPAGSPAVSLSLDTSSPGDPVLKAGFVLSAGFSDALAVNVDLAALTGLPEIGNLNGSANLEADIHGTLTLDIGIDLADPTSLFIYGDSGLSVAGSIRGTNLTFIAGIGPLGLYVQNGQAAIDADGDASTPGDASFTLDLPGGAGDRIALSSLDLGSLTTAFTAGAGLTLPLFFPTQSNFIGNLTFSFSDVTDPGSLTVGPLPDFGGLLDNLSLLDGLPLLIDGFDSFLGAVQDALDGNIGGIDLPFVGDSLKDGVQFIKDFRTNVVDKLRDTIENAPERAFDLVQQAVFDSLGPSGLGLLQLTDLNSDGHIDFQDVDFGFDGPSDDPDAITFHITLGGEKHVETGDLDFGLPALGLQSDGGVGVDVGWSFNFGFGLTKDDGFFIDTTGDELAFTVDVTLPDSITGTLAFLRLDMTPHDANHNGIVDDAERSRLHGEFSVDVAPGETRVGLADIGSLLDIDLSFGATVDVDVDLRGSLDLGQSDPTFFPSVVAEFKLAWGFADGVDADHPDVPSVAFDHVGLDIGSFFSDAIGPILDKVNDIVDPIRPLLDVVTAPIPVISDLAGEDITLIDIASALGFAQADLIQAIADIADLVGQLSDLADQGQNLVIEFGDFSLDGLDPRNANALDGVRDGTTDIGTIGDIGAAISGFGGLANALSDAGADPGLSSTLTGLADSSPSGSMDGFSIPILTDPGEIFGLLLGKPANIVLYDIPNFNIGFKYSQYFPIWGPLGAEITGQFGVSMDFKVGFDTLGIQEFAEGGFEHPLDIFNGFFVSDRANADGTGADVPEIEVTGSLTGAAVVNIGVASVGVGGGVFATVDFNLDDPDHDGKVRIPEMVGNVLNGIEHLGPLGPICIFDVTGKVEAHLFAFIDALFGLFHYEFQFGPSVPLIEFTIECPHDPILATDLHDGDLRLNMGPNAADRLYGDVSDDAEDFTVAHVSTEGDGSETVAVSAFGFTQNYSGVRHIIADGGAEDDVITFTGGVKATADIKGGFGNDRIDLAGEDGAATVDGGVGYDTILGGGAGDSITGGKGNDVLLGGGGADRIDAGAGDDVISGDAGDDVILAGAGDDTVGGGSGADYIDGSTGVDEIHGDATYDEAGTLVPAAGPGGNDTISAGVGNDKVFGDGGDDLIGGGPGSDSIEGGGGADTIWGDSTFAEDGTRTTTVSTQEGNDTISGGDGGDTIQGEGGSDLIHGNAGNDTVHGGRGADTIYGDDDNDVLFGDSEGDTIYGNAGDDKISGNSGNDMLFGDSGSVDFNGPDGDALSPDLVQTSVAAGDGNDTIGGDAGDDFIFGGGGQDRVAGDVFPTDIPAMIAQFGVTPVGHDVIFGDGGQVTLAHWVKTDIQSKDPSVGDDDTLYGNLGNDTMFGGAGNDHLYGAHGPSFSESGVDRDLMFGDSGEVVLETNAVKQAFSTAPSTGGNDEIWGELEFDSLIGGAGNDTLLGSLGDDVLIGDNGEIRYDLDAIGLGTLDRVETTSPSIGGNDNLSGSEGNDIALGGFGGDVTISGAQGDDVLVGDNGVVNLRGGVVESIKTTDVSNATGGDDNISGADGNDVALGGVGNDTISGAQGADILVGDNGLVDYDDLDGDPATPDGEGDLSTLDLVVSYNDGLGGNDNITGAQDNDIAFGGFGGDTIGGATGDDILVGDNGSVIEFGGHIRRIETSDAVSGTGGNDSIFGDEGNDIALGGVGNDSVRGSVGEDILLGDNGLLRYDVDGTSPANLATLDLIQTGDPSLGGVDYVSGSDGRDTVVGGAQGDFLFGDASLPAEAPVPGAHGEDILIGDGGRITRVAGMVNVIETIDPFVGGADTIQGDDSSDTMLGGAAGDTMYGNAGADVMLGDNGILSWVNGDSDPTTLDLIETRFSTAGAGDSMYGGTGDDTMFGGTAGDYMEGNDGRDLEFGDHGHLNFHLPANVRFESIDMAFANAGGDDTIHGNAGDDTILGQQGDDLLYGEADNDDIIGGHNRAGGIDEQDDLLGGPVGLNDSIDGGTGQDVIAGDNADIVRQADTLSTRDRLLNGTLLYAADGSANVLPGSQADPDGAPHRDVTLLDHSATPAAHTWGRDSLAGGQGNDTVFGQLGDDVIQGDGTIEVQGSGAPGLDVLALGHSVEDFGGVGTDGDDYIEGNGGNDLIYGDLGQDDIVGGSSDLYGLTTMAMRPDGSDTIFGGAGTDLARNDAGDGSHPRDADVILGDNGRIFRPVHMVAAPTPHIDFYVFAYDVTGTAGYSAADRIVPRAIDLIDYTPYDGNPANDVGAGDVVRGESGDDSIHGALGNDTLYGDAGDDDVFGESGNDWMSGGTGADGMLGDDGKIMTSRNGTAEPLYGVVATTQSFLYTPGHTLETTLNPTGRLTKAVDLEPFDKGGNDTMYGGLGDDSMHGGAGNDAMSGAEALPGFFANPASTPLVGFNDATGNFTQYNDNAPLVMIAGHALNFEAFTNAANQAGSKVLDGNDVLFGDDGNDWLVGGTQSDHLYGGFGNDILNADDRLETSATDGVGSGFDDADTAFGGAGRDTLIGNTGLDRLIDWVGEYNAYYTPFAPFGLGTVQRDILPQLPEFLYAMSKSDGADQTRSTPGVTGTASGSSDRNGEPYGELGLVIQQDPMWQIQTGAPTDPQAGNTPGKQKDQRK